MPTQHKTRAIVALIALPAFVTFAVAQEFEMARQTIDDGGVMYSSGGAFGLSGTIGQADAGIMASATYELTGGFWFALAPGDCNMDGGVNLSDHGDFLGCLTGPDGLVGDGPCPCFDLERDRDVDLVDFAGLQGAYRTPH